MNNKPLPSFLLISFLVLLTSCREEPAPFLYPIGPGGDLADRVAAPDWAPGDLVTVNGLVDDTGALTSLTSYAWGPEGITREVFFLEPRRPEGRGELVTLSDAEVLETGVYGYGVRLSGGVIEPCPVPAPEVKPSAGYFDLLDRLDLNALSAHPEHNGGYRPAQNDFAALTWTAVDWTGAGRDRRWLLRASRLTLPPFADPLLERWLQIFVTVDSEGKTLQIWVGIRGSFLE